jgi:cyclic-di-AMP phosphodiesterase PgpH
VRSTERRDTGAMLQRLSGDPGRSLGERVVHHGSRVLLLVLLAAFITMLFPPSGTMDVGRYEEGMVAAADVIARIPFSVPKAPEELARDRTLAMESVPPTFDFVAEAADTMEARLVGFFERVDTVASIGNRAGVEAVLRSASVVATPAQVDALLDGPTRRLLRRAALAAARDIIPLGVLDAGQALNVTTPTVTVRQGETERAVRTDDVVTQSEFFERALAVLPPSTPPDLSNLLRLILIRHIEFSYILDVVATELDRDAAARSVPTDKGIVLQGQAIVRAADPVTATEVEMLNAYEDQLRAQGLLEASGLRVLPLVGAWVVTVVLLTLFGLVLFFFRVEVYAQFRWLLLLALLVAVYFVVAAAIARNDLAPEWLPIAFVALPAAVLWDTRISLVLVLIIATITGTIPAFAEHGTVLAVATGGGAAAMSVRAVRRRSDTWRSIAIIACATGLVLLGYALTADRELGDVAQSSLLAAGNATVSALLATGFLWLFELFTGITTDQTLLEWADPTRPLLKRLSLEAPGTYAHTINVANLAEAAANAIGANGLLCRVGLYYHDVGKMLKPHYFVENQPEGRNPHDKLKPGTSAAIVREHVTEGERLAREAKVPPVILDFILQHHGTQRIGFFYEKALEEEEGVDEERFAYPGPKPQTRETAVAMLADSCESAARAMRDPTAERIRDLIHSIIQAKLEAGQLDEAPLTLREMALIEEQFAKILGGAIHRRIEYPATKHLTDAPDDDDDEGLETS